MGSVRSHIISHPLTTFFVATVGLGWCLTIGVAQLSSNPAVLPLIAIPVSFVPALVAWLVLRLAGTTDERAAWRHRLTRVRVGWRWYVVALLALPVAYLVGIGLAAAGGATSRSICRRLRCSRSSSSRISARRSAGEAMRCPGFRTAPAPSLPARGRCCWAHSTGSRLPRMPTRHWATSPSARSS